MTDATELDEAAITEWRRDAEGALRDWGWWDVGTDISMIKTVDPHGTDICGMCAHRHQQQHHRIEARP